MSTTQEFNIEDVEVDGRYFRAKGEAKSITEDQGIGSYEYWGAKGVDVQIVTVLEEIESFEVFEVDEEGGEIKVTDPQLIDQVQSKIWDTVEELARKSEANRYDNDDDYRSDEDRWEDSER